MKLDASAADTWLGFTIERYRVAFTRHCTCGDPECSDPQPAAANDYRVVSCSMFCANMVTLGLLRDGNTKAAVELLEATRRYAEPAITNALDCEPDIDESFARMMDMLTPEERQIFQSAQIDAEAAALAVVSAELAETMPESPAIILDPEESDHLYAQASGSRRQRDA